MLLFVLIFRLAVALKENVMIYKELVPVPTKEAPGKLMNKKDYKATYVMYEYDRTYNKETQKTNPKRKMIGKLSDEDSTLMYPNDNYFEFFSGDKVIPIREEAKHSACIKAGTYIVLTNIVNELKLNDLLKPYFEDKTGLALDLALYSIITEDNAAQHYADYAFNHPLLTENMYIYSDSTISNLLGSITPEKRQGFLKDWNDSKDKKQKIYISYDSTNKNYQGKNVGNAEYGKAKDDDSKPIINLSVAYNQTLQTPLTYETYCGSINDISQFRYFLVKMQKHGYISFGLILDRGYFGEDNIIAADEAGVALVIMVKGKKDFVGSLIDEVRNTFESRIENRMGGYNTYGITVQRKIFESDKSPRYIHIYYNRDRAAKEEAGFNNLLKEYEDDLNKHIGSKYTPSKNVEKYYRLTRDKHDVLVSWERRNEAINQRLGRCGYFCILTTEDKTAADAFALYKGRDCSEKLFSADKSFIGGNAIRAMNDNTVQGKFFIEFLALIIRNRMHNLIKEMIYRKGRRLNYYNVPSAIAELEKIELVRAADGTYVLDHAVTKTQKDLLAAFGISEEEANQLIKSMEATLTGIDRNLMKDTAGLNTNEEKTDDEEEDDELLSDDEDDDEEE